MSFLHRNRNQNSDRDTREPGTRHHMWTASASDADVNRQSRNGPSNWNVNVGSMMHPSNTSSYGYGHGQQYGSQYGPSHNDWNGNGIPDHLEGSRSMNEPWHKTGSNSWARSSTSTYVDGSAPAYPASTRSDWDHYAVNHEKALLGDPIPYRDDALNHPMLANNYTDNAVWRGRAQQGKRGKALGQTGPVHTGVAPGFYTGNGPVVAESALDARGRPLRGNYSTGTVIEDGYHPGYGPAYGARDLNGNGIPDSLERGSMNDRNGNGIPDNIEQGWERNDTRGFNGRSRSFGSSPLYGASSGWGSQPIYRDVRDTQTPLLPDNPWTHNELGQDYLDGRGNAPTRAARGAANSRYGNNNYGPNYHPSGRTQHY